MIIWENEMQPISEQKSRLERHLTRSNRELDSLTGRLLSPEEQLRLQSLNQEIDDVTNDLEELEKLESFYEGKII
jgi:chorismate-pyruvate lyase